MKQLKAYSYSCLMGVVPDPVAAKVLKLGESIPEDRLYKSGDGEYGRAKEVHVTVKYGIVTDDLAAVMGNMKSYRPMKAKLRKTGVFWNDDCIVIRVGVDSRDLERLNHRLSYRLSCVDTHPDYKPHVTIAYVKKDDKDPYWFKKYLDTSFEGMEFEIDELVFSVPGGEKKRISLTKGLKLRDRVSMIAGKIAREM